jgi:hypothetical protein
MNNLPQFETSVVPGGFYEASVLGEVQEKESTFDRTKTYFELAFSLSSRQLGNYNRFIWSFTPKSPKYADFLLAIGGRKLANGNAEPPRGSYVGKMVVLEIGKKTAKNDPDKVVNEVLKVMPYNEESEYETEPPAENAEDVDIPKF